MIKLKHKYFLLLVVCLLSIRGLVAADFTSPACRPVKIDTSNSKSPGEFTQGLLWEVTKPGIAANYVFGTIHVANAEVNKGLAEVKKRISSSQHFVMEALPEPEQIRELLAMMYFTQGNERLADFVPADIYAQTVQILSAYHLNEDIVARMRPWAAYTTMSYPADRAKILDVTLLEFAKSTGATLHGLETMAEQGQVFTAYTAQQQAQFLIDGICNYALIEEDFNKLLEIYLTRNIGELYLYGQRYSYADNELYADLTERILNKRNGRMVERMQALLEQGATFVAVGALHLPGEDGILASLKKLGYKIRLIE